MNLEAGAKPAFPPSLVVQVKALACELPHLKGLPLSRFSIADIRQEVLARRVGSGATIWRWPALNRVSAPRKAEIERGWSQQLLATGAKAD